MREAKIYMIEHKTLYRRYIGFTLNLNARISCHKNCKENGLLHRDIKKYGWDAFETTILYESPDEYHTLLSMEPYFIGLHQSHVAFGGYNQSFGGEHGQLKLESYIIRKGGTKNRDSKLYGHNQFEVPGKIYFPESEKFELNPPSVALPKQPRTKRLEWNNLLEYVEDATRCKDNIGKYAISYKDKIKILDKEKLKEYCNKNYLNFWHMLQKAEGKKNQHLKYHSKWHFIKRIR